MKIFHDVHGWIGGLIPAVNEVYEVAHGGVLDGGVVTGYGSHTAIYALPIAPLDEITLTIEGDKAYSVMMLGETLNFTATFSDLTLNTAIPASILDRQNNHVYNALITIKDGIGKGTFTPEKAMDYFITEAGINYHTDALNAKLILTEEFYIRVVGS